VCSGDAARAADWLFNHMDDIDTAVNDVLNASSSTGKLCTDTTISRPLQAV
jgi:uncharacterized UBP type Zn finger protein